MRKIININHKWAFRKGEQPVPHKMPEDWDLINIPHTWNAIDGQDGDNDYYRGEGWYVKPLHKGDLPHADRYFLELQGANSSADVYLDGKHLTHHDGGYSTFRVEITRELTDHSLLAIRVDNSPNESVYPQMADFTFYGGIYRDVNVICVYQSHFDLTCFGGPGIMVTPQIQGKDAQAEIKTYVTDKQSGQTICYRIFDRDGNLISQSETAETRSILPISHVRLWQGRKDPYLYTCRAELLEQGRVVDRVETTFGCRTFQIDPEEGFILNGKPYPLRGVSRHQDRWGIGNALLPHHHEEDMDLICEMGATTIRLAHYQHDQYFYNLCDQRGMVVWAEIPYISKHLVDGKANTMSQMRELIVQNYNHPSIVVWGLSNEISIGGSNEDLLHNHRILNDLCHDMDKTRLTTIAAVSMCKTDDPYLQIPDVVSYNHYFGWYGGDTDMNGPWFDHFHQLHPNIPIGCSEYGCEALNWHSSTPHQGDYTEEYQAHYHEELIKQLFSRKYLWATHVWNMFDFGADARNEGGENGQNHKGLVTFDRKYKKDAFYAYKAWLSDEPFVHICGKRYVDRVEDTTKVTVYSNQKQVELFANGLSLGKKEAQDHFFYFDVPNRGETKLLAVAGACRDESLIRKVKIFNENYRLKEQGAVLNWFDVESPAGYLSLNDKVGDILATEQGNLLFSSLMSKMLGGAQDGKLKAAGFEMTAEMMTMMNGFTLLRLLTMAGGMMNVKFTKEDLLALNTQLNQIKK